ncbi:hypothetical protein LWM68_30565 [Niabella sp. W65]|nr:hypothetical protein [Niabella sp. W65]MCH7366720.1 hypothetical protein [Niabella sp. W65]ULT42423.1 hypothetical protein KRR40_02075 [Niabella sp. I65]
MKAVFPADEPPSKLTFTYTTLIVLIFLTACQYKKNMHTTDTVMIPEDPAVLSKSETVACSIPPKQLSKRKRST